LVMAYSDDTLVAILEPQGQWLKPHKVFLHGTSS
jgi:hypothetical protein